MDISESFRRNRVLLTGHFVYNSGLHGDKYLNKDAFLPHVGDTSEACRMIAEHFAPLSPEIEVVSAPVMGGIALAQWTAFHLTHLLGHEVLAVYAEKSGPGPDDPLVYKRGYDRLIAGKVLLGVEDILTKGRSARKLVEASRLCEAQVVGIGALGNRGNVSAAMLADVPELFSLYEMALVTYAPENCPLCAVGVPINTDVGHGGKK
jgi:orotate phosphoribosyltransferase